MNFETLKQTLQIDKHNLDEELIKQPFLFQEVAEKLSNEVEKRDTLKNALKEADATLDQVIRKEAAEAGEKVTEKVISSRIETDETYLELKADYVASCGLADRFQGLKEAFMQRSYVLKDLCSLQMAGYYERDFVMKSETNNERVSLIKKEMNNKRKRKDINNRKKVETTE